MVATVEFRARDSMGRHPSFSSHKGSPPVRRTSAGIHGERRSFELSVTWRTMTPNLIVASSNQSVKNSPAGGDHGTTDTPSGLGD